MKRWIAIAASVAFVVAAAYVARPLATADETPVAETPELVGFLFYADWCGSCKILDPKLQDIQPEFQGQKILFTRFDLTDDFTKEQSLLFASLLGVHDIYLANQKTGFMLLVNVETGEVLGKLVKTQTKDELRAAITAALASVDSTNP